MASARFFLIAGEPSGDRLGGALITALREKTGDAAAFDGVGGVAMTASGLNSRFPIADIAVMGIAEVAPRLPTILRRLRETTDAVVAARPDALITIDAPAFSLRVAERVRRRLPPEERPVFVHYVAPTVWAWRPKRAERMARHVDHLLALLPFEPPYFERVGLGCTFVGHPITEQPQPDRTDPALRAEFGVDPAAPLIVALPGSRRGEIERLGPVFGETLTRLAARRPDLSVLVPAAEHVADRVAELVAEWPNAQMLDPRSLSFDASEARKRRAIAAADAALAASGTVSLELAAARTPMVIAYRVNAVTAALLKRLVKVDTVTLVNLIAGGKPVPEFLQEFCEPEPLAEALDRLLDPDDAGRSVQLAAMEATMQALGEGERPSERAADAVLTALQAGAATKTAPSG